MAAEPIDADRLARLLRVLAGGGIDAGDAFSSPTAMQRRSRPPSA